MKRNGIVGIISLAIGLAASAPGSVRADSEPMPETDGEIWNRGVDLYRAGDMTNAIAVLKPLMLSKTHGVRASELVGAIEFERGREHLGESPEEALRSIESAATDLQAALRSSPDDARMGRNFARAADRLPELREQARIEKALKEFGQQDPSGLLGSGVREARSIMVEFPVALTNDARAAVSRCEAMARRVERLGDMWIALKKGVAQSVTNEQQAMTITAQVDEARAATDSAAKSLADLDPSAQSSLAKAESSLTRFWKLAILPPEACDEAILSQTNSLVRADTINGRDWQRESLEYMHAFRAKFGQWAQMYGQRAQSDTNMPPFTAEAQAEIRKLADESIRLQEELAADGERLSKAKPERRGGGRAADHAAKEFRVLEKLNRIRELLPKDKNGGGQNQQQGGAQNQSQGNGQQNQDKDDGKDGDRQDKGQDRQDNGDEPQDGEQNQGQDKNGENGQEPPRDGQDEQPSGADGKDDRQVEDVLRKAQERSDQHEADKKARMRNMPLPSNDRDW